jgi:competence protein ComEA
MPDLTPRQLALYALALLALVVLAAWYVTRAGGPGAPPVAAPSVQVGGAAAGAGGDGGLVTVHVAGAVRQPGVYRMRSGSRVNDAVTRAGGPRRRADLSAVNLAAEVQDGRQILVPLRAQAGPASVAGSAATGGAGATPASSTPGVPLNLNTATPEQLDELDGIGPATAQHIIEYREAHGGFGSVEELDQVPGIGEARMASLRDKVRV